MHTAKRSLFPLALLLTAAPALASDISALVDFESGPDGWVGSIGTTGGTTINPTGGVGGSAGFQTVFNDFGITFRTSSNLAFLGDYTQQDQVTISIDTRVDEIGFFGSPVSRPWFVELRDFDSAMGGYPWSSVWFKFADISEATHSGFTNFSVTIDDTSSTMLPTGWKGYGAEDPMTFEPVLPAGVTFADILAGVDEVVFSTLEPGFFFGFTDFDVTVDNIAILRECVGASDFCNGDGGDQLGCTDCPCGNNATPGTIGGCLNQSGSSARLLGSGSSSVTAPEPTDLRFDMTGGNPNTLAVLTSGDNLAPQNMTNPCFGLNSGVQSAVLDGLRCAVGATQRHGGRTMDANGAVGITNNGWGGANGPNPNISAQGGFVAGQTRYFQVFYRADETLGCQSGQNTTQAIAVTFQP